MHTIISNKNKKYIIIPYTANRQANVNAEN